MPGPKQDSLPLINGLQATYSSAGRRLLSVLKAVVAEDCPKRVVLADEIGIKEQHLNDAINENGKHFAVQWLPAVIRYDRASRIANEIAGWQGLKVVEKQPITDAEWRLRVSAALARHNGVGEAILRDAMEEAE